MALSVAAFLGRIDPLYVQQLTQQGTDAIDEGRIALALVDAQAEIDGWLARVSSGLRPGDATMDVHVLKIALYLLTLNRPGDDFKAIRAAYADTVAFYTGLITDAASQATAPSHGRGDSPCSVFNASSLKGFS